MKKFRLLGALCTFTLVTLANTAQANMIYQYTGNTFDTISDTTPPASSFTTSMSVTGSFTVSLALSPMGLTDISGSVLAYSFSDGRSVLNETNSQIAAFMVGTDGNGQIDTWWITVMEPDSYSGVGDQRVLISTQNDPGQSVTDWGWLYECFVPLGGTSCAANLDYGENTFNPGSWSTVPVPAAAWLFGSGLLGLVGLARRKKAA